MSKDSEGRTNRLLERHGHRNTAQLESDAFSAFIVPCSRTSLTDLSVDERLGKVAKIVPPTEDTYVFQENWPPVA